MMMEYNKGKKEIIIKKETSKLDRFVLDFIKILNKYTDYVVVSGYVSILLGRTRATEDVDIFIKEISEEKFSRLYNELEKAGFWCLNAENIKTMLNYLKEKSAIRFARKGKVIPNFEVKYPKTKLEKETFEDFLAVILPEGKLKISSLERHIAFKRYFLKSDKDKEDALHIEELFKDKLDYEKINKLKWLIKLGKNGEGK